jgi:hypothetical protein
MSKAMVWDRFHKYQAYGADVGGLGAAVKRFLLPA